MGLQIIIRAERPLWMHKEDRDTDLWGGNLRECASGGCPAVFVLQEPMLKVNLTQQWQYFIWAANYNMTPAEMATEFDYRLAFCNMTGLTKPGQPRRNYLENKDLGAPELPKFDKDRTCARSVLSGRVEGNYLVLDLLDGNVDPPLKKGKSYPRSLEEVNKDDYLYMPWTHPWLWFAANTVVAQSGGNSKINPFPRGKRYDWTGDDRIYTWMPHVSRAQVRYPLSKLTKVTNVPSPYRA